MPPPQPWKPRLRAGANTNVVRSAQLLKRAFSSRGAACLPPNVGVKNVGTLVS